MLRWSVVQISKQLRGMCWPANLGQEDVVRLEFSVGFIDGRP